MAIHEWASMSWPAFQALPSARAVGILPLGAIEAHGPHLPLGTDVLIASAMAQAGATRLAKRGYDAVLLPPMTFAPAPFAADFAGTIDAPAAATTALVAAIAGNAARHGVRITVVANAHHDPAHVSAIRDAVPIAAARGATIVFPDLTRRRWASRLGDEFRSGACHAGRYETSIVLAVAEGLVDRERMRALTPNPQSLVDAIRRGDRSFAAAGGPEAYFGWPAESSADEGHALVEALGAIIEDAVVEVMMSDKHDAPTGEPQAERLQIVSPVELGPASGFSHGVVIPAGWATVAVAGQTAAGAGLDVRTMSFVEQFDLALAKVLHVVTQSGARAEDVTRMTVFVTDMNAYLDSRPELSAVWRRHLHRHYPAMTLVQVSGLVDAGALVEIQADAAVPRGSSHAIRG